MSGKKIRLVHASPQSVYTRVQPWDSMEKRLAMFDPLPQDGESEESRITPDVTGYGDIHNAYVQHIEGKTLFNVGSVGNPLDLAQSSYAILEGTRGSKEAGAFSIQIVRVPYDIEEAVRQAQEAGMPELEEYVRELRTARYRGLPQ